MHMTLRYFSESRIEENKENKTVTKIKEAIDRHKCNIFKNSHTRPTLVKLQLFGLCVSYRDMCMACERLMA